MSQQSYARVTVTKQEQEQIQKRELLLRQVNKVLSQIDHLCGLITEGGNESEFEMANLRLLGQSNLLTSQSALAHRRGDTEGCHMGLERVARHQERTQSAINKMKSLSPGQKDAAAHVLSNFYSYFNNALATGESDPLPPPSVSFDKESSQQAVTALFQALLGSSHESDERVRRYGDNVEQLKESQQTELRSAVESLSRRGDPPTRYDKRALVGGVSQLSEFRVQQDTDEEMQDIVDIGTAVQVNGEHDVFRVERVSPDGKLLLLNDGRWVGVRSITKLPFMS